MQEQSLNMFKIEKEVFFFESFDIIRLIRPH